MNASIYTKENYDEEKMVLSRRNESIPFDN
jgi:hypothetical protein